MRHTEDVRLTLKVLKQTLRERGISYQELAKAISLSLSGVKKILNGNDISYNRLSQICQVMGLSVKDLLLERDSEDFEEVQFGQAQEEYFVKNILTFHVFWKLAFERLPTEKIPARLGLTPAQLFKHLRKLDEMGLIELHAHNKVQVPKLRHVRGFGDGPLIRKLYREWSIQFMEEVAKPRPPAGAHFMIRYLKMKTETYDELKQQLITIERQFATRAIREMAFYSTGLVDMRWICAIHQGSFVKDLPKT